jgi:hypothetical protein
MLSSRISASSDSVTISRLQPLAASPILKVESASLNSQKMCRFRSRGLNVLASISLMTKQYQRGRELPSPFDCAHSFKLSRSSVGRAGGSPGKYEAATGDHAGGSWHRILLTSLHFAWRTNCKTPRASRNRATERDHCLGGEFRRSGERLPVRLSSNLEGPDKSVRQWPIAVSPVAVAVRQLRSGPPRKSHKQPQQALLSWQPSVPTGDSL